MPNKKRKHQANNKLSVSVCIPAYNEGKNIEAILQALIEQKTRRVTINKIIVVSSGSTDNTVGLAQPFVKRDARVEIINQKKRLGKASAINAFLKRVTDSVVVIESADTVPSPTAIEHLCRPFIDHDEIGMTGGAPIPVNDKETFCGFIVHTWWWFHRNIPRFGEIIAFRNCLPAISTTTAVDEAYIQAKIVQMGLKAVHIDEAIVRNKGPETVADILKQRRRIFNGHSRLMQEEGVKIDNMTKSSLRLIFSYKLASVKHFFWLIGGIALEILARYLGAYDAQVRKINPFVWDTATTTKDLALQEVESVRGETTAQLGEEEFSDNLS